MLANSIRQQARASISDLSLPGVYLISSYDGAGNVKVNVTFDPDVPPQESNWMPLGCIGVGNGWGMMVGPQVGDQVMCVFEQGDFQSGVVVARIYSAQQQAMPVPSGEIWMVHKTTTSIKFLTNGDLDIVGSANLNATVAGNVAANVTGNLTATAAAATVNAPTTINGNTQINGTLAVSGNVTTQANITAAGSISDVGGAHGSMANLRSTYDTHTHPNGTPNTGTPNQTV